MNDLQFNSLIDLYNRLKPALNSKVLELQRHGINYIQIEDIWEYLKKYKWQQSTSLQLSTMVDDILNTPNNYFVKYIDEELNKLRQEKNKNNLDLL